MRARRRGSIRCGRSISGSNLLKVSHSDPFWNVDAGRVMVKRRARLYGLELENRAVSYGKINPAHATEIFIREALVNDVITWPLDFLAHNRGVRDELEHLLTRARDTGFLNLDEALYRFLCEPPAARSRAGCSGGRRVGGARSGGAGARAAGEISEVFDARAG